MEYLNELTIAQSRVYDNLITALSYSEIQKKMKLSRGGVRCHVAAILIKMEVNSRLDLACQYYAESDNHALIEHDFIRDFDDFEWTIFTYTIKGYSLKEIMENLGLGRSKVVFARQRIYKIAEVKSAFELVCKCYGVKGGAE
jgi:DNA-binding CsgD family transcriptional regulator